MSNDTAQPALYEPIYIEEYRNRRERRKQQSDFKKGQAKVNYLPFSYISTISEFPSNTALTEAGLEPISARIYTKLLGKHEMEIANLNSAKKLAEDGKTYVDAYTGSEVLVKIIAMLLQSWTIVDYDTKQPVPVTEENILGLLQPDFDYLAAEVNKVLAAMNPEQTPEGEPKPVPSEEEKN